MKANRIFDAFSSIDPAMQTEADASMQDSNKTRLISRPRLRSAVIAASFVLLVAMIPIIVLIANRTTAPHYKDINQLPCAQAFDETNGYHYPEDAHYFISAEALKKYREKLKQWPSEALTNHTAVIGKPSDISSVIIEEGDVRYHIVTLTVNVIANCTDPQDLESFRTVYVCRYEKNLNGYTVAEPYSTCGIDFYQDMGRYFFEDRTALFLIDPIDGRTLDIAGTTLDLSEYGDCYMTVHALVQDSAIGLLSRHGFLSSETDFYNEARKRNSLFVTPRECPALAQIPGAESVDSSDDFAISTDYPLPSKDEFIKMANEEYTVLTGTEYNIRHVLLPEGNRYWHMTTFSMNVHKRTSQYSGEAIVKILYMHPYKNQNGRYLPMTQSVDYGFMLMNETQGFYVLEKITDETIKVGKKTYKLSDYPDYTVKYVFKDHRDFIYYTDSPQNNTDDTKISYEEFGIYDPYSSGTSITPIPPHRPAVELPIPGAEKITSSDNFDTSKIHPLPPQDEFIRDANEKYTALTGSPSDTAHYLIPDGEIYWHITVTVIKIKKCTDRYTGVNFTKLISVHQYKKENGKYVSIVPKDDNGIKLMNGTFGFYVLEKLTDQSITVGNTTYPLADYADYMIAYTFLSDYDHFLYSNDIYNYTMDNKIPYETLGIYERDLPKVEPIKPPSTPNNDPAITTEIAPAPITPTE